MIYNTEILWEIAKYHSPFENPIRQIRAIMLAAASVLYDGTER